MWAVELPGSWRKMTQHCSHKGDFDRQPGKWTKGQEMFSPTDRCMYIDSSGDADILAGIYHFKPSSMMSAIIRMKLNIKMPMDCQEYHQIHDQPWQFEEGGV